MITGLMSRNALAYFPKFVLVSCVFTLGSRRGEAGTGGTGLGGAGDAAATMFGATDIVGTSAAAGGEPPGTTATVANSTGAATGAIFRNSNYGDINNGNITTSNNTQY